MTLKFECKKCHVPKTDDEFYHRTRVFPGGKTKVYRILTCIECALKCGWEYRQAQKTLRLAN